MNSEEVKKIENIFRSSESHDELFDAFQGALRINLTDPEIYKILIANQALSTDEIKMFAEKLIKEFPEIAFDLLMWTGKILENKSGNYNHLEESFNYYRRAGSSKPESGIPLLNILNLYNYDIDLPANGIIIELCEKSMDAVSRKSEVYYALSAHYKRCGDRLREIKYFALAEKSLAKEGE
ncbi:MAG: hypothetical protein WC061_01830 [Melioribacteraceae bacterium]